MADVEQGQPVDPPPHEFESWSAALDILLSSVNSGEVFRGQQRWSWPCDSALERAMRKRDDDANRVEAWSLSFFRAYAWRYLSNPPPRHDLISWLVLAQHYGMPTRLVDWTRSPMVACYFAYRDLDSSEGEDAALWILDAVACRNAFGSRERETPDGGTKAPTTQGSLLEQTWDDRENDLLRDALASGVSLPVPLIPPRPDNRMAAQRTVLTADARLDGGFFPPLLFQPVRMPGYVHGEIDATGGALLHKCRLPASWRTRVLDSLRQMGINETGLFPGLDGVGREAAQIMREGWRPLRSVFEDPD